MTLMENAMLPHRPCRVRDGEDGESITPLADQLIQDGIHQPVVIIAYGMGGTPIPPWQRDGDLNEMALAVTWQLQNQYIMQIEKYYFLQAFRQ
jgi:hypothetical protein